MATDASQLPEAVVVVATDAYGRVLFGRRADTGKFTLPAGGLNPGEPPADGARRELKEETGLDADSLTPLQIIPLPTALIYCFSAHVRGIPHSRNDPDQEVASEDWKFVDVRGGVPQNIWNRLAGPPGNDNLVRQLFDLKKSERIWNWDCGMMDLRKSMKDKIDGL